MKKLGIDELFLISEIVDKMDIDIPFPKQVDSDKLKKEGKTEDEIKEIAAEEQSKYGAKLISILVRKAHKAKEEIKNLIREVTGKDPNEMTGGELISTFTSILKQDGVAETLQSADK